MGPALSAGMKGIAVEAWRLRGGHTNSVRIFLFFLIDAAKQLHIF